MTLDVSYKAMLWECDLHQSAGQIFAMRPSEKRQLQWIRIYNSAASCSVFQFSSEWWKDVKGYRDGSLIYLWWILCCWAFLMAICHNLPARFCSTLHIAIIASILGDRRRDLSRASVEHPRGTAWIGTARLGWSSAAKSSCGRFFWGKRMHLSRSEMSDGHYKAGETSEHSLLLSKLCER